MFFFLGEDINDIVPFDVFTHCFVLRTKGVLESFSFGLL
jgi:hypothetical protein